jgi:hypothetical protein
LKISISNIVKTYLEELLRDLPVEIRDVYSSVVTVHKKGSQKTKDIIAEVVPNRRMYREYRFILYAGKSSSNDGVGEHREDIGDPEFGKKLVKHIAEVCDEPAP